MSRGGGDNLYTKVYNIFTLRMVRILLLETELIRGGLLNEV